MRNVATMGGVLADADYASDPPSMLIASRAVAEVTSLRGTRRIPIDELIVGHYATSLEEDELITRVVVPRPTGPAAYRKLRTRSQEDRPSSSVAAVVRRDARSHHRSRCGQRPSVPLLRGVRGVEARQSGQRRAIGQEYSNRIDYIDNNRGTAAYRRHIVGVEVRRALMAVSP